MSAFLRAGRREGNWRVSLRDARLPLLATCRAPAVEGRGHHRAVGTSAVAAGCRAGSSVPRDSLVGG